jgi:polysaccharide biosynthesis/export protein
MKRVLPALLFLVLSLCQAAASGVRADYMLRPSDFLEVKVFQEDDLTREVRIAQDYSMTLPLVGTVSVKGKSLRQLEVLLVELYNKDFLVNPQITIVVKEYAKRTVNVQGQVGEPGAIEFPAEKGLTLLGAIARAGGFTRLSDRTRVILTRQKDDGNVETFKINASALIEGKSGESWMLQEDDSIFVPERIL